MSQADEPKRSRFEERQAGEQAVRIVLMIRAECTHGFAHDRKLEQDKRKNVSVIFHDTATVREPQPRVGMVSNV
jgi:hypothetical protein